jgi:hypothetical protein
MPMFFLNLYLILQNLHCITKIQNITDAGRVATKLRIKNPLYPAYGCGFCVGIKCETCTHTQLTYTRIPMWVRKPMTCTIYV